MTYIGKLCKTYSLSTRYRASYTAQWTVIILFIFE